MQQGVDKLSKIVPRNDLLDQIKTYITGSSQAPMVVHGHSGCGKTSVMASVAQLVCIFTKRTPILIIKLPTY